MRIRARRGASLTGVLTVISSTGLILLAAVTIEQIGAVFAGLAMLATVYLTWKTKQTVVADAIIKDDKLKQIETKGNEIYFKVDGRLTETIDKMEVQEQVLADLRRHSIDQSTAMTELRKQLQEKDVQMEKATAEVKKAETSVEKAEAVKDAVMEVQAEHVAMQAKKVVVTTDNLERDTGGEP